MKKIYEIFYCKIYLYANVEICVQYRIYEMLIFKVVWVIFEILRILVECTYINFGKKLLQLDLHYFESKRFIYYYLLLLRKLAIIWEKREGSLNIIQVGSQIYILIYIFIDKMCIIIAHVTWYKEWTRKL